MELCGELSFQNIKLLTGELEKTDLKMFYGSLTIQSTTVVIHCGTNNIDTIHSDEIGLSIVAIARLKFHCYQNIEVIVS